MNNKKEILQIINKLTVNSIEEFVSISSIDRRLLLINSNLVLSREYISLIDELLEDNYLVQKNEEQFSFRLTQQGLDYLTKHSEE